MNRPLHYTRSLLVGLTTLCDMNVNCVRACVRVRECVRTWVRTCVCVHVCLFSLNNISTLLFKSHIPLAVHVGQYYGLLNISRQAPIPLMRTCRKVKLIRWIILYSVLCFSVSMCCAEWLQFQRSRRLTHDHAVMKSPSHHSNPTTASCFHGLAAKQP